MTVIFRISIFVVVLLTVTVAIASTQRPRWSGWELEIKKDLCDLQNEFRVHPGNLETNGGFLQGTSFELVRVRLVATTSSRDANVTNIGQAMVAVHIKSHVDRSLEDRIGRVIFGGIEKDAVVWGERQPGDKLNERYAAFWFYGFEAETLISRLSQGEALPLAFETRGGTRAVETVFAHEKYERFPAWEAAFRGCALANQY